MAVAALKDLPGTPTPSAVRQRQPRVAPFVMVRRAALPLGALVDLIAVDNSAGLPRLGACWLDARAVMEEYRPGLEDALYSAVPRIVDPPLRRRALALRRAIHNGRKVKISTELRQVLAAIDRQLLADVESWYEACLVAQHRVAQVEQDLPRVVDQGLRKGLLELARDENFRRALTLASSEFAIALERRDAASREMRPAAGKLAVKTKPSRFDRTLFSYAMRAGAKTSPFSVFLEQIVVDLEKVGDGEPAGLERQRRITTRSYLNRGILTVLQRAAALAEASAHLPILRLDPTLDLNVTDKDPVADSNRNTGSDRSTDSNRITVWSSDLVTVAGRLWRSERPFTARLHRRVIEVLRDLPSPVSRTEVERRLVGLGLDPKAAAGHVRRLIDKGVLGPEPLLGAGDRGLNEALVAALVTWGTESSNRLASLIEELSGAARAFADCPATERIELLRTIHQRLEQASAVVDRPPLLRRLTPLFEDGFDPSARRGESLEVLCGKDFRPALGELASVVQKSLHLAAPYRALRDAFVERFGPGGVCDDVPQFLRRLAIEDPVARLGAALRRGAQQPEPPAIERAAIAISAFVQPAFEDGELLLVVNQLHPGGGWLSARLAEQAGRENAAISDGGSTLRQGLEGWQSVIAEPFEPVDFTPCVECNPLQAHPPITRRSLIWPGESAARSDLAVADTVLAHQPDTGLLELRAPGGGVVQPVYLGGTLPSPAWGGRYWLTLLAHPYQAATPPELWAPPQGQQADGSPLEVSCRQRCRQGRIVLARQCWWMHRDYLRRVWLARDGARRHLDVAADRRRLGVPRWLYAKASLTATSADPGDAHKPLWVDSWNPFCLELLEPLLQHSSWILLTEALPGPRTLGQATHLTEFLVEMAL